ncbi:uncharacterized protein TNCV_1274321 [Trichonephila clavipes]|nr:uncharacterized protein TNCV_1274321 [Trichonephila clavipes]
MSSSTFTWHVSLTKVFLQSAVPSRNVCTLNSRRATSPQLWLVQSEERWDAPDHSQDVLPQNWGGIESNRTVICVVLKATDKEMPHLALCHDEFRGPRSGLCRSDKILTTARDLEMEVNEDDIEELIMGHKDELKTEELQEILNEEHQETQRNVSPSEQEEDERGPMPPLPLKIFLKSGMLSEQWS